MVGWQAMNHADLDQLLILQEKDARIARLRKELAALPEQRTRLLRQMEAIKQKALDAKKEVAGLEKDIRDVEGTIENKRSYIGKMKTLQSNTRKNEEYQKCIQEVEKTEAAIDELENAERPKRAWRKKSSRCRIPRRKWKRFWRASTGPRKRTSSFWTI